MSEPIDISTRERLVVRLVEPGPYRLTCLPLRLAGAAAAPTRAILETLP
jgi:kynurenine formamidase